MFLHYVSIGDFVSADMSGKYLQMGFTRARRHANHKTGTKYCPLNGTQQLLDADDTKATDRLVLSPWSDCVCLLVQFPE
ncbi:Domain of unknown function (DUF4385)-containing protein [uncultured virus]|nr:Domain of unknown function (DUF4385)-containing protein [uncultured virus]